MAMLGEALRLIRVFHDLKQNELAKRLGVSQSHLSDLERGERKPSSDLISRYAEEFDLPVSSIWFFDEKLTEGAPPNVLEKARGVIADKVLDFLRIVELRRSKI